MKISSRSGASARWLNAVAGVAMILVGGFPIYLLLPSMLDGTKSLLDALVSLIVALCGLVFVVRAMTLGRHEWIIGDTFLRIRAMNDPDVLVYPEQLENLERETYQLGGDRDNGLPCVSLVVTLTDGRILESPRMFDDAQINRAWRKIEALQQSGLVRV